MAGQIYIGNTRDNILCLVQQHSRSWFGTSGAFGVQASDDMAQVFPEPCFIALRVRAGGGVYANLDLLIFCVPYAILAAHVSSRWVFSMGMYISLLHIYVLFRIKGTIFPLNRSHS